MTLTTLTASWAVENREAVAKTLRATFQLEDDEDLVITQIQKARRRLQLSFAPTKLDEDTTTPAPAPKAKADGVATNPSLQETTTPAPGEGGAEMTAADGSGGVRIVFIIGVTNKDRFESSKVAVQQLSNGNPMITAQFIATLDRELQLEGKEPVSLDAAAIVVKQPKVEITPAVEAGALDDEPKDEGKKQSAGSVVAPVAKAEESSDTGLIVLAVIIGALGLIGLVMYYSHLNKKLMMGAQDPYQSKITQMDDQWMVASYDDKNNPGMGGMQGGMNPYGMQSMYGMQGMGGMPGAQPPMSAMSMMPMGMYQNPMSAQSMPGMGGGMMPPMMGMQAPPSAPAMGQGFNPMMMQQQMGYGGGMMGGMPMMQAPPTAPMTPMAGGMAYPGAYGQPY
jgi:hypothetical protein